LLNPGHIQAADTSGAAAKPAAWIFHSIAIVIHSIVISFT
jgi:hypothetical protein